MKPTPQNLMLEVEVSEVSACQIATDGSAVRLHMRTSDAGHAAVTLPLRCLQQLIMTLPQVASMAVKVKYKDNSKRIVFQLGDWKLQKCQSERVILALSTSDGFEAAFSLSAEDLADMAASFQVAVSQKKFTPKLLN